VKESFFVVKDDEVVIKGLGKKISNNHVQEIFFAYYSDSFTCDLRCISG
jgi:hypothetical protein